MVDNEVIEKGTQHYIIFFYIFEHHLVFLYSQDLAWHFWLTLRLWPSCPFLLSGQYSFSPCCWCWESTARYRYSNIIGLICVFSAYLYSKVLIVQLQPSNAVTNEVTQFECLPNVSSSAPWRASSLHWLTSSPTLSENAEKSSSQSSALFLTSSDFPTSHR